MRNRFLNKHSATILTVLGGVGLVLTTITAVKATVKAVKIIDAVKIDSVEVGNDVDVELTKAEVVSHVWKCYIPTSMIMASTLICIIAANGLNKRKQAALTSAYVLLETTYKQYREKVKELYGNEADENVVREIGLDNVNRCDMDSSDDPNVLLFYDGWRGEYFQATMDDVLRAELTVNRRLSVMRSATLNDFYTALHLSPTEEGRVLGWTIRDGQVQYGYSFIDFIHDKAITNDGLEVYIILMPIEPHVSEWL